MAVKKPPVSVPDHAKEIVGDQGERMKQEPESGKQVYRKGAETAEADIDIGTKDEPIDITSNGQGTFESGQRDTGGAEALAVHVKDDNSNTFDFKVDWLADNGDVLITDERPAFTNIDEAKLNLVVRSDHFEVRIVDNGGATAVHGSVNAH